jgi:phosphopantothenoylcysteine decarboxylase/phosphopantothenate--cysteine ligase
MMEERKHKRKNIVLGVTGGIAAYKSAEMVRLLRKSGFNIKVIMTQNATRFISTLTVSFPKMKKIMKSGIFHWLIGLI